MGGHDHCAVYGCSHRRDKNNNVCGFYEFPKQTILKTLWIQASGRQDLNLKNVSCYTKVCGCHFVSGKPNRKSRDSVDSIPNINIPQIHVKVGKPRQSKTSSKSREWTGAVAQAHKENVSTSSVPKRTKRKLTFSEVPSVGNEIEIGLQTRIEQEVEIVDLHPDEEDSYFVDSDHNYASAKKLKSSPNVESHETQTEKVSSKESTTQTNPIQNSEYLEVKLKYYEHLVSNLKSKLVEKERKTPAFNHKMIKDDKSAMFWTGLSSKEVFCALFQYLEPKAKNLKYSRGKPSDDIFNTKTYSKKPGKEAAIPLIDEFFAVLVRLKVGLLIPDISQRLGVSEGHFSKMFEKWVRFLRDELEALTRFPTLSEVQKHMPEQFSKYHNTRVIIDCTELYCQKPSSLKSQRQLWSNYKHHNTYKALVGISPDGSVVYVSNLYGGSCSDKFITKDCGLIEHLQPGDSIMADRGFQIDDILPSGVGLNLPPFVDSKLAQLTAEQVEETRRIASVRIHVERAIQRIKIFHILDGVIPLSLHPIAEDIFKVCAYLTNFQSPIIA